MYSQVNTDSTINDISFILTLERSTPLKGLQISTNALKQKAIPSNLMIVHCLRDRYRMEHLSFAYKYPNVVFHSQTVRPQPELQKSGPQPWWSGKKVISAQNIVSKPHANKQVPEIPIIDGFQNFIDQFNAKIDPIIQWWALEMLF
ncbi:Hypothetical_protein [Hexamita inflata]|uniref:Hypothetical_protein n=1 Tax=Hexamita inflata TaxID=28002 RepID=A0AA86NXA5_9EUKA|nr:Hypothetical protein HINF_LOCUS14034 [Hexamita inflata]